MVDQKDLAFGRAAIMQGFIDSNQLAYCLQWQRQNQYIPLEHLLIKSGYLTLEQANTVKKICGSPVSDKETTGNRETTINYEQDSKIISPNVSGLEQAKTFGRYKLLEEIGRGGMGKVYKAYDSSLDRVVALKLLLTGEMAQEEDIQRFLREARATASLKHPNIVGVYDIGVEDGQNFFTMDLIDGLALGDFLKKNRLSNRAIVQIVIKVVQAIGHAHDQGIIHRDLKPANIMIDKDQDPKVMDFGLAKVVRDSHKLSQSGIVLGTLQYMPPEQASGKISEIDARSDVYSLGGVLYEALTGKAPFSGTTFAQVLSLVLDSDPILPTEIRQLIPKDLESICLKALEKKKEHRYQSAWELAEDLQRFARGEPVIARPLGLTRRLWKKIKSNKKTVLAIVVVGVSVLALLVGVSARIYFEGQEQELKKQKKIQQTLKTVGTFLSKATNAAKLNKKYGRIVYTKMGFKEEQERLKALKKYREMRTQLEQTLFLNQKHLELKTLLFKIEKEIGLLALGARNYILSELSFERCKVLGWEKQANVLLQSLQKKKKQVKQAQTKRVKSIMKKLNKNPKAGMLDEYVTEIIRMPGNHIAGVLLPFLKGNNWQKSVAIQALGKIGNSGASFAGKDVVEWLMHLLKKIDSKAQPEETEELIWALGRLKDSRANVLIYEVRSKDPAGALWNNTTTPHSWIPITGKPKTADDWNMRGLQKMSKGDFKNAIVDLLRATKLNPKMAMIYSNLAYAYQTIESANIDNANISMVTLGLDQKTSSILKREQMPLKKSQNLGKSIKNFSKAIKLKPKKAMYYNGRGLSYMFKRNYKKALVDFNKAIKLEPDLEESYLNRAYLHALLGRTKKALADFNKIIGLNPSIAIYYVHRGMTYYNSGKYNKAIKDYTIAAKITPSAIIYNNRGLANYALKKLKDAVLDYNKAIRLDPQFVMAYNNQGLAYYAQGKNKEALECYNQAIKLNPTFLLAYGNRSFLYYMLKKFHKAIKDCNKAIKLNPKFALAYGNRAMAYMGLKENKKALRDCNKAIKLNPNFMEAFFNRGYLLRKKNPKKAIDNYNKALKLAPNLVSINLCRADAYKRLEKHRLAIKDYRLFLKAMPKSPRAKKIRAYIKKHRK